MTNTPDRFPGPLEDEEVRLSQDTVDPSVLGSMKYVSGSFRFMDSLGVFNPRSSLASLTYEQGSSLTLFTTSSSSFQQKWRFTTSSLALGSYELWAFAEIGTDASSAGAIPEAQIQLNDTTTLAVGRVKPNVEGARVLIGGAFFLSSVSGVQNIDFDIKKYSGLGSVTMANARAFLLKVA